MTSSECIAPDDVVALLAGELDEAATAALDAHVDACQPCLELLAAVVRSPALVAAVTHGSASTSSAMEEPPSAVANVLARVHPGERVARYVVRDEVGHGGMGVVYAAWDPELDRKVAIKLLRARVRGSAQARARLLREARAIAQLSHRNVISVFDVGEVELAGDRVVFVAMELIDGPDLRTWRWQEPRGWREIVAVYLDAARGLQAAHAAGVIHRDFKPGNVMIADESGERRVVVLDFGLARVAAELEPSWDIGDDEPASSGSTRLTGLAGGHCRVLPPSGRARRGPPPSELRYRSLTAPRALLGTPGYIAPELQRGGVADARSDEWSLCMALAEALCGVHPQLERGSVPLAKLLAQARVPIALRRVLERGLADEPGARFGSMYDLCSALESVLAQRRRRVIGLVTGGGIAPLAALVLAWMPADRDACTHSEARIADTWNDARRARVDTAFAAHEGPWTEVTRKGALADVDDFAARWTTEHGGACRAAKDGTLLDRNLDARMACLDRGRTELDTLLAAFEHADRETAINARTAIAALPDPGACVHDDALPPPAVDRDALALVHAKLAEAHSRERTGHLDEARALLDEADELARALGDRRTESEVLIARATAAMAGGDLDAAERELFAGLWAAEDAHDPRLAARAHVELIWLEGYFRFDFDRAKEHGAQAGEAIASAGGDEVLAAIRLRNLGWTELQRGDPTTAEQHFTAALAVLESIGKGDGRDAWSVRGDRAAIFTTLGRWDDAERELERVRAATEAWVGPDHPELAPVLNNIGALGRERGRLTDALAAFDRVVRIVGAAWGDEHPSVARALLNRGTVLADLGRDDEAEQSFARAAAIFERTRGAEHPELAQAWKGLAGIAYARNRLDEAKDLFERALALELSRYGEQHPSVAVTSTNLAMVLVDLGRPREALPHYARALAIFGGRLGPRHPMVATVHDGIGFAHEELGELELAAASYREAIAIAEATGAASLAEALFRLGTLEQRRGRTDEAIASLERSLALRVAAPDVDPRFRSKSRFALAQVLVGRDPRRAKQLARDALADVADDPSRRSEIETWLAAQ